MSYLYQSDALVPQERPMWKKVIVDNGAIVIKSVFDTLAFPSGTMIADIVSFYGTQALKSFTYLQ